MKKYAIGISISIGLFFTLSGKVEAQYWGGHMQPIYGHQAFFPAQNWNMYAQPMWGWSGGVVNPAWGAWNNPWNAGWNQGWNGGWQQPWGWNGGFGGAQIAIPLNRGGWINVGFSNGGYWGW
jgi:hypothetical protein